MKTDQELRQIAVDLAEGLIFTHRQISNKQDVVLIFMGLIFAPIPSEQTADIGLIYEYMSEAGPRAVNGCPSFLSYKTLSMEEYKKMLLYYGEYVKMRNIFIGKPDLKEDEYRCGMCGGVFQRGRSDEEAKQEQRKDFPDMDEVELESSPEICDTCYQKITPVR